MFYGFYHGKSPFFTTIWGICWWFCSNHLACSTRFFPHLAVSHPWHAMGSTQRPMEILQRETPPVNQTEGLRGWIQGFFWGNFGDFSGFPPRFFGGSLGVFGKMSKLTKSSVFGRVSSSSFQLFRNWFRDVLICFTLSTYPTNHGISQLVVWRCQNPAIQIQTPPLEGPMILRVVTFRMCGLGLVAPVRTYVHTPYLWLCIALLTTSLVSSGDSYAEILGNITGNMPLCPPKKKNTLKRKWHI